MQQFEKKLTTTIIHQYYLPAMKAAGATDGEKIVSKGKLLMQPITDIHLRSYDFYDWETRGDIRFVWMFGAVAVFILLIACINFLNLSTERSSTRAKEWVLRKVMGSQRTTLVMHFFTESLLYSIFSFVFAVFLLVSFLPLFNKIAGKQLHLPWAAWWF